MPAADTPPVPDKSHRSRKGICREVFIVVFIFVMLATGADSERPRFIDLGHKIMLSILLIWAVLELVWLVLSRVKRRKESCQ